MTESPNPRSPQGLPGLPATARPHRDALPAIPSAINDSLLRLVEHWEPSQPVPAKAVQWLPLALDYAQAQIEPCGVQAATVMLRRLWMVCPMPSDAALDLWLEMVSKYPDDLVESAITRLIETRTWDRDPPLPGHVLAPVKAELGARLTKRNRLRLMADKAKLNATSKPAGKSYHDMTADERAAFDARMAEMKAGLGAAPIKRMPKADDRPMTDAEFNAARERLARQAEQIRDEHA